MNFFKKIWQIKTGTYEDKNYNAYQYWGSNTISMTKDQLTSFESTLSTLGLSKPVEIDNMISKFSSLDKNNDGKLTSAEIHSYLESNGYSPKSYYNSTMSAYGSNSTSSQLAQLVASLFKKS